MSDPDRSRPPSATAWAIVTAGIAGTAALSTVELAIGITALAGVTVGVAARLLAGSHSRVTLGAALLPIGVTGVVAGVGATAGLGGWIAALAPASALVGAGMASAVTGGLSPTAVQRTGDAGVIAGGALGAVFLLRPTVSTVGGLRAAVTAVFDPIWSVETTGVTGPVVGVVVAASAVALAVRAVPAAAFTTPSRREGAVALRTGLVRLIAGVSLVAIGGLVVAALVGTVVPQVGWVVSAVSTSGVLRGTLAVTAVAGTVALACWLLVRALWTASERGAVDGDGNAAVPTLIGVGVGTTAVAVVASRIDSGTVAVELVTAGLLVAALLAVVCGVAVRRYASVVGAERGRTAGAAVGSGAVLGGGVLGATVDLGGEVGAIVSDGALAAVCAIGAGLVAYRAGAYGNSVARDVGREAVPRDVQLVQLTWTAAVAGVGVVLATAGLGLATALSPTLSVPATVGVGGGLLATGAAAWLLFQ